MTLWEALKLNVGVCICGAVYSISSLKNQWRCSRPALESSSTVLLVNCSCSISRLVFSVGRNPKAEEL